jgi:hypothetical protein
VWAAPARLTVLSHSSQMTERAVCGSRPTRCCRDAAGSGAARWWECRGTIARVSARGKGAEGAGLLEYWAACETVETESSLMGSRPLRSAQAVVVAQMVTMRRRNRLVVKSIARHGELAADAGEWAAGLAPCSCSGALVHPSSSLRGALRENQRSRCYRSVVICSGVWQAGPVRLPP